MLIGEFLTELELRSGVIYTSEQREFIKNVNKPTFVFASPGTGKTASAVGALVTAELFYGIPGDSIYALSFTNKATSELSVRHKLFCEKIGIQQRVHFQTLHKLCREILSKHCGLLGMQSFDIKRAMSMEETCQLITETATEKNWRIDPDKVSDIVYAIQYLNSSLVFEEQHIMENREFINCGVDYEVFTDIRCMLYKMNKLLNKVQVSDILLYALELLLTHEELSDTLKKQHALILADEAQDLSLLQLGLINKFTNCPVLIGDQKQQIYGFQGACPETRREFKKMHPDAVELSLTQSFRCKDAVATFATPTILKNNLGGEDFKGCGEGGNVEIHKYMDVDSVCTKIEKDYFGNDRKFTRDVLFLYRNNFSALPLIESLYKKKIPFRTYKYPTAIKTPFIKEMCEILDFVRAPETPGLDLALSYIIPEFRGSVGRTPLGKIARKLNVPILTVNYDFRDTGIGNRAMTTIMELDDMLKKGNKVPDLFNKLWPLFYNVYAIDKERYTDKKAEYYTTLINPVIIGKTYSQFLQDEREKLKLIDTYEKLRVGVRCYTMHAAKGLEADDVHIIDADMDTIPNKKILDRTIRKGCLLDAAKDIRNERSLVYVAITRARENVYIYHSSELSPLFYGKDDYDNLDLLYENTETVYDDIPAFEKFTRKEL